MRKHWLLLGTLSAAAALAIGAIACGDDDGDGDSVDTDATQTALYQSPDETPDATDSGTPSASGEVEVPLTAVGGSGVTGTGTLSAAADGGTEVSITIDAGLTEGEHQNHVHGPGTCAGELAPVEETLTTLEAGADGSAGPTTTAVTDDVEHFQDGTHYFAVHAADGTVVACGDIPSAG